MKVYHLVIALVIFVVILLFAEVIGKIIFVVIMTALCLTIITIIGALVWLCEVLYRLWKKRK